MHFKTQFHKVKRKQNTREKGRIKCGMRPFSSIVKPDNGNQVLPARRGRIDSNRQFTVRYL